MAGPWEEFQKAKQPDPQTSKGPWESFAPSQAQAPASPSAPAEPQPATGADLSWSDVPGQALKNFGPSLKQFGSDLVHPIMHPLETGKAMADLGLLGPAAAAATPAEDSEKAFSALGQFLKNRYGSSDALKHTLATDPVGVASDLATVLSGGEMAAARAPGIVGKVGKVAGTVGRAVDPLSLPIKSMEIAGKGAAQVIGGLATHTGAEPIKTAFRAGAEGGQAGEAFRDSMRGNVPMDDVVNEARAAVAKIRQERGQDYRTNKALVDQDKTVLDFDKVDDALAEASAVGTFKGQSLSPSTQGIRQQIGEAVRDWKALDPADFHTVEGMDALKRKIGDIRDGTEPGTRARLVADQVYNAIKGTIESQAPGYAKVMKGYEEATKQIKEIEKTLSLNPNASIDTALRKLQSVMRDNVNTNYGQRRKLAEFLVQAGAPHLMERLAGQAMSQWTPRGLAKLLGGEILAKGGMGLIGAGAGAAAGLGPALGAAATLPTMSPRIVGEAAHAAGRVYGAVPGRAAARTSFQTGRAAGQLEPREMVRQDAKAVLRDKPEERFTKSQIETLRTVARGGAPVDTVMAVKKMLETAGNRIESGFDAAKYGGPM